MKVHTQNSSKGFALVATIAVMSLLVLVSLGMLSLSSVTQKITEGERPQAIARANARMALMIALGELQKSSGHDQRITASADAVMGSTDTNSDRKHWVGVWDSSTFNPNPQNAENQKQRHFLRWLVSSQDPGSLVQADPTQVTVSDPLKIFDGMSQSDNVLVDKIPIIDARGIERGSYAYWVQDNGLKASAVWSVDDTRSDEENQASRLMVAAGPDIESFNSEGSPVSVNNLESYYENIEKLTSLDDLFHAFQNTGGFNDAWVKENYHDLSIFSHAILSDTKLGGLQRDLSLAFEMDGSAEAESATKFNQQTGEFVAGGDYLEEGEQTPGMPVKARHPYRLETGVGAPFEADINDISGHSTVMRGPTWWLLRDYANLYKSIDTSSGGGRLQARAYYPNRQQGYALQDTLTPFNGHGLWSYEEDVESRSNGRYIYKPAKANYSPSLVGSSTMISYSVSSSSSLEVWLDQMFFLWNPYNCEISCDNLVLTMGEGLPGQLGIWITGSGGNRTYHQDLSTLIRDNISNQVGSRGISYLIKDESGGPMVLKPGEIVIASSSAIDGEANLGYNWESDSGVKLDQFTVYLPETDANGVTSYKSEKANIVLEDGDQVGYLYKYVLGGSHTLGRGYDTGSGETKIGIGGSMRNEWTTYLPTHSIAPSDLTNSNNFGPSLQYLNYPHHGEQTSAAATDIREYVSPDAQGNGGESSISPINTVSVSAMRSTKVPIGMVTTMMKPAYWAGENPNPVEVFTRFNPIPSVIKRDFNRICGLNQLYNFITDPDPTNLTANYGINFSALSPRAGFWGLSSTSNSTTRFPLLDIPRRPLLSLAALSHANISISANESLKAIGNSWSSPFVDPDTTYSLVHDRGDFVGATAQDLSWHMNDSLFDRYFFSGFAGSTPNLVIRSFFSGNKESAGASPALRPYQVFGSTPQTIYDALNIDQNSDGYKKSAAFMMIDGAFNVNSTSVRAWEAFLRANRGMEIDYVDGGTDSSSDESPFPSGSSASQEGDGAEEYWSGLGRLTDLQVTDLATIIVRMIKERGAENGPFMSLSDFVNRKMGDHQGILQAAIDESGINDSERAGVESQNYGEPLTPIYDGATDGSLDYFQFNQDNGSERSTAMGIPGEINQAELLLPLAPRLRPRSDTFTIRAYGEAIDSNGKQLAEAYCEAVVQRVPEYVDATLNDPWDEPSLTPHAYPKIKPESSTVLKGLNTTLGRKYKIVSFRWLNDKEI